MSDPLQLLLEIQGRDLAADQLRHRRATLPERTALADDEATVVRLDAELTELEGRIAEVQRAQRRLEDEVAALEAKQAAENVRLYSGSVTSPRELQAIQEEIEALARRQRMLEDDLLEIMETAEPLLADRVRLQDEREARRASAAEQRTAMTAAEAVIDAELDSVTAARDELATDVPADLLATYEKLRARLGGVGIARLEGAQCTGCHLTLPAMELDAVRHATNSSALVFHEECGRILVKS